jgi:predicted ATPase
MTQSELTEPTGAAADFGKLLRQHRLAAGLTQDQLESDFADGVWLVDLAPLTDASLVAQTIATTLGIRDEPGRLVIGALTEYLRNRHVLLILDNCEHLIDACSEVNGARRGAAAERAARPPLPVPGDDSPVRRREARRRRGG